MSNNCFDVIFATLSERRLCVTSLHLGSKAGFRMGSEQVWKAYLRTRDYHDERDEWGQFLQVGQTETNLAFVADVRPYHC